MDSRARRRSLAIARSLRRCRTGYTIKPRAGCKIAKRKSSSLFHTINREPTDPRDMLFQNLYDLCNNVTSDAVKFTFGLHVFRYPIEHVLSDVEVDVRCFISNRKFEDRTWCLGLTAPALGLIEQHPHISRIASGISRGPSRLLFGHA